MFICKPKHTAKTYDKNLGRPCKTLFSGVTLVSFSSKLNSESLCQKWALLAFL